MEKELHEHPAVIGDTLHRMVNPATRAVALPDLPFDFATLPRITISACGSAFYAGLVGRWWFEAIARIPTDADVASEFRYRTPPLPKGGLGLLVTPVGRDRRHHGGAALHARAGQHVLSIVNVPESSMARESRRSAGNRGGPGDRRRQHQGVHRAALGVGMPGARRRRVRAVRSTRATEAAMTDALLEVPSRAAEVLDQPRRDQGAGAAYRRSARRAVSRTRQLLPDCAGRRAEAEGDQLHPRRGLCRRRDEARPDRADRQGSCR